MSRNVEPMRKSVKFFDDYDVELASKKKHEQKSRRQQKREKFATIHEFLLSKEPPKEE
jgi:hypothetical protein